MNIDQTEKLLMFLGSAYPKLIEGDAKDMVDRTKVWCLVMGDIDYDEAKAAAVKYIRSNHYAPTPADIINLVKAARADVPTAEEAWAEVLRNLNPYRTPQWSHQLIQDAVRTMGFLQLCNSENPSIDRAQFIKIYNNLRDRQHDRQENEVVVRLVGGTVKLIG